MLDYFLKSSLEQHRTLTVIYQKGREITVRDIEVFEISGDSVKAFCHLRKQPRVFKKENILSASFSKSTVAQDNTIRV